MHLVSQNPYHILGLVAGANQRTVEKQKGKINAYQKVGKDIEFDDDLIAVGKPERSNGSIEKAFSNIESAGQGIKVSYPISTEDFKKLKDNKVAKVRIYTNDGYLEEDMKAKHAKKIPLALKLIE